MKIGGVHHNLTADHIGYTVEKEEDMIVYVDNGFLIGWYFEKEGQYFGDGTKQMAIDISKRLGQS